MFPLMETIKIIDGIPQNLLWHQKRFEKSYHLYFLKTPRFQLENLIEVPPEYQKGIVKLRFLYDDKNCFCQYQIYKKKKVNSLKLVTVDTLEYAIKYTDRKIFDELLKQKQQADDVLIVKDGRITDTSFSNIILFNGKKWVTPAYPLLKGTTRERLIAENKIFVEDILVNDLKRFKKVKLINAFWDIADSNEIPIQGIY